jgi:ABC-type transporter MlaC component
MRKYLMSALAVMFLLSSLALLAQPRTGQDAMKQDAAQSDSAKPAKKAKKEKKAKAKKAKKDKKMDKKADEMQH